MVKEPHREQIPNCRGGTFQPVLYSTYLGSPHEPELEDVHMASTLQCLVSGVVGQVILFVLLEQVAGVHLVAVLHQTLSRNGGQNCSAWPIMKMDIELASGKLKRNPLCVLCVCVFVRNKDPTSSLTSRAEHCSGTDIILCGFHVTELALGYNENNHHTLLILSLF